MVNILKKIILVAFAINSILITFSAKAYDNDINLIYPKNNAKIEANSTFFVGNTNPKADFTINDNVVKLYKDGAFVSVQDLKTGKNEFELKSTVDYSTVKKNVTINRVEPQKPLAPIVRPLDEAIIVTEKEAPLRATPYGNRLTPIKKGMTAQTVGIQNKHYKVKYGNGYAYILQAFAKPVKTTIVQNQIAKNIFFNEDEKFIIVNIELEQPVLVEIKNNKNNLSVRFDNTTLDFTQVVTKSPYIKEFTFAKNTFNISIINNINGYNYFYDNNHFILKIRKPFKQGLKGKIIAIDPGHGGKECGAVGPTGVREKDINLPISLYLKETLEKSGAKVIMTRNNDNYVDLYDRVDIAQNANADILISIHNNSLPDGQNPYITHGTSTYYFQPQAVKLATSVQNNLLKATGFKNLGIKHGSFVLTRPTIPVCILIEVGFMIHPEEYEALQIPSNQKRYADGIKQGIIDYFK